MSHIEKTICAFDEYNRKDPNIFIWQGIPYPQEYFFAIQLHLCVLKLSPLASEELLLASRCQHIGRWEKPRNLYPEGRIGYLTWRKDLSAYHAQKAAEIMASNDYSEKEIERVAQIVQKQRLKSDADVQTIENALCLVFLQFQYEAFQQKHEAEKVVEILRKSLLKMDAHGHQFALQLEYSAKGMKYIQEALALLK